jgi:hypothetical protein
MSLTEYGVAQYRAVASHNLTLAMEDSGVSQFLNG